MEAFVAVAGNAERYARTLRIFRGDVGKADSFATRKRLAAAMS